MITYTSASTPSPDALQQELADEASCQHQDSSYFDTFVSQGAVDLFVAADADGAEPFDAALLDHLKKHASD